MNFILGWVILLVSGLGAWAAETAAPPAAAPAQTALPWAALLITGITPLFIAGIKQVVPRIPRIWLPWFAPLIGAVLQAALNYGGLTNGDTMTGMILGASGVCLREAVDQVKKLGDLPPSGPRLAIGLFLILALPGCASISYSKTHPDGSRVEASARSLFSNSAIKGLTVDATTKTTTNGFRVTGSSTEPNPESITATGAALGELIGTAAKAAAK